MDSIYIARKIFDLSSYPFQIHMAAIFREFHLFFSRSQDNLIEFWECSSRCNWSLYKVVDKETKSFNPIPLFLCKSSWDYSKKNKCNDLANRWKIIFQALDAKGKQFLDLLDSDNNIIKLSYIKGSLWLRHFSHSNSLCTKAIRAIINHTPIGEFRLRFFPREDFGYYKMNYLLICDI